MLLKIFSAVNVQGWRPVAGVHQGGGRAEAWPGRTKVGGDLVQILSTSISDTKKRTNFYSRLTCEQNFIRELHTRTKKMYNIDHYDGNFRRFFGEKISVCRKNQCYNHFPAKIAIILVKSADCPKKLKS
jgi:hypothetical protein